MQHRTQFALLVIAQQIFGIEAELHKGTHQLIVIRIKNGIALALVYVLIGTQFGRSGYVENGCRNDFAPLFLINEARQFVHLKLVQIGNGRQRPVHVAIQSGIAQSGFGFVAVVHKHRV